MAGRFTPPYKRVMKLMTPVTTLDQITVHSFLRGFEFREAILGKINHLNPGNASHRLLEGRVRILLDMIEESRLGHYVGMPLSLFARVLVELDHFVRIDDDKPDTWVGGYLDDFSRIQELFNENRDEIGRFVKWKQSLAVA